MIRILLILLSILGIILAVLLAVILLVLFVPICYRVNGRKKEDIYVKGWVSWLFHIVHISFWYEDGKTGVVIRVFGIPVIGKKKPAEVIEEEARKAGEEAVLGAENAVREASDKPVEVIAMEKEPLQEEEQTEKDEKHEKQKRTAKHKVRSKDQTKEKKSGGKEIVGQIKLFWQENKEALRVLFKSLSRLLKALLPKKVEGKLWFGTGDPGTTGELTGALAVLYGFYGDKISIYPDFTQAIFMGELLIEGKIRLFTFLRICITVLLDKNVRRLITNIRNLKEEF